MVKKKSDLHISSLRAIFISFSFEKKERSVYMSHKEKKKHVLPLVDAFMFSRVRVDKNQTPEYAPALGDTTIDKKGNPNNDIVEVRDIEKNKMKGLFSKTYIPAFSQIAYLGPHLDPGVSPDVRKKCGVIITSKNSNEKYRTPHAKAYQLPLKLYYNQDEVKQVEGVELPELIYIPNVTGGTVHENLNGLSIDHVGLGSYCNEPYEGTHASAYAIPEALQVVDLPDIITMFDEEHIKHQGTSTHIIIKDNNYNIGNWFLFLMKKIVNEQKLSFTVKHNFTTTKEAKQCKKLLEVLSNNKKHHNVSKIEINNKNKLHFRLPILYAAHDIFPDDEITWNYGIGYDGRDAYTPGFVPRRTLSAPSRISAATCKIGFKPDALSKNNEIMFHLVPAHERTLKFNNKARKLELAYVDRGKDDLTPNCEHNNFTPSGRCLECNPKPGSFEYYLDFGTFKYSLPPPGLAPDNPLTVKIIGDSHPLESAKLCAMDLNTGELHEKDIKSATIQGLTVVLQTGFPDCRRYEKVGETGEKVVTAIGKYRVVKDKNEFMVVKKNLVLQKTTKKHPVESITKHAADEHAADDLYVIEWKDGSYNTTVTSDFFEKDFDEASLGDTDQIRKTLDKQGYFIIPKAIKMSKEMRQSYAYNGYRATEANRFNNWKALAGEIFNTTSRDSCRGQVTLSLDAPGAETDTDSLIKQIINEIEQLKKKEDSNAEKLERLNQVHEFLIADAAHKQNIWSNPYPVPYPNDTKPKKRENWPTYYRDLHTQVYNNISTCVSPYLVPRSGVLLNSRMKNNNKCPRQMAHKDYETSMDAYSVVIPVETDNTTQLLVWPGTHKGNICKSSECVCIELKIEEDENGDFDADMLIFSDSLIHAGSYYKQGNNRFHFFCDVLDREFSCRQELQEEDCKSQKCVWENNKCQARSDNATHHVVEQWRCSGVPYIPKGQDIILQIPEKNLNQFPMPNNHQKQQGRYKTRGKSSQHTIKINNSKWFKNHTTDGGDNRNGDFVLFKADMGYKLDDFHWLQGIFEEGVKGIAQIEQITWPEDSLYSIKLKKESTLEFRDPPSDMESIEWEFCRCMFPKLHTTGPKNAIQNPMLNAYLEAWTCPTEEEEEKEEEEEEEDDDSNEVKFSQNISEGDSGDDSGSDDSGSDDDVPPPGFILRVPAHGYMPEVSLDSNEIPAAPKIPKVDFGENEVDLDAFTIGIGIDLET